MVEKLQVENPANASMHYGYKDAVGAEGKKYFDQLNQDVYEDYKKAVPKRKGTPLGVKIILGIGAVFCGFKFLKSLFTKLRH